ncbi:MAG: hypothetical protein JWQ94_4272 [Tardiphaga sp.]|nr:hypothetical protein [Tardiphaga sp.]
MLQRLFLVISGFFRPRLMRSSDAGQSPPNERGFPKESLPAMRYDPERVSTIDKLLSLYGEQGQALCAQNRISSTWQGILTGNSSSEFKLSRLVSCLRQIQQSSNAIISQVDCICRYTPFDEYRTSLGAVGDLSRASGNLIDFLESNRSVDAFHLWKILPSVKELQNFSAAADSYSLWLSKTRSELVTQRTAMMSPVSLDLGAHDDTMNHRPKATSRIKVVVGTAEFGVVVGTVWAAWTAGGDMYLIIPALAFALAIAIIGIVTNTSPSLYRLLMICAVVLILGGIGSFLYFHSHGNSESVKKRDAQIDQILPLINSMREHQAELEKSEASPLLKKVMQQYGQLQQVISSHEKDFGVISTQDRQAAAQHLINEMADILNSANVRRMPGTETLVIETAPNKFIATFNVPMMKAPKLKFYNIPAGSTPTILDISNVGFVVLFQPPTIKVERFDMLATALPGE